MIPKQMPSAVSMWMAQDDGPRLRSWRSKSLEVVADEVTSAMSKGCRGGGGRRPIWKWGEYVEYWGLIGIMGEVKWPPFILPPPRSGSQILFCRWPNLPVQWHLLQAPFSLNHDDVAPIRLRHPICPTHSHIGNHPPPLRQPMPIRWPPMAIVLCHLHAHSRWHVFWNHPCYTTDMIPFP